MKKIFVIIAAVAAVLASCAKEEAGKAVVAEGDFVLQASLEQPEGVKTSLDADFNVVWNKDDAVVVYDETGMPAILTTTSEGTTTCNFSGDAPEGYGTPGYALYPSSAAKSISGSVITFDIPAEQAYKDNSFGAGANIAAGSVEGTRVSFKNALGALLIQLKGSETISKIEVITKSDERLNGEFTVDASAANAAVATGSPLSDAEKMITLNCGNVVLRGAEATKFYITLPAGTMAGGFTVKIYDGEGNLFKTFSAKAASQNRISRSSIKAMPVREFVIDLSADETANCYIVTKPGFYRFKADVRGNGVTPVGGSREWPAHIDEVPIRAAIIWETLMDRNPGTVLQQGRNVYYKDGYVYFETNQGDTYVEGSAVIAILQTESSDLGNNNCLWSWHIWCTKGEPSDVQMGSKIFMDRNLGAITNQEGDARSRGMLYQWGRKDPFLGACAWNNSEYEALSTYTEEGNWQTIPLDQYPRNEQWKVDITFDHPRTFIQGSADDMHWAGDNETCLWGTQKTMFDPCPAGYKVPDNFDGFQKVRDAHSSTGLILEAGSGAQTYWPYTGMRGLYNHLMLSNHTTDASYWTNRAEETDAVPGRFVGHCLNISRDMQSVEGVVKGTDAISYCVSANPVRCEKIQ